MSILYVGAYSWSASSGDNSNINSTCGLSAASQISVNVSGSRCSNCSAMSTSSGDDFSGGSRGANTHGGSMSILHVGAYSWSSSRGAKSNSSSMNGLTAASDVSVYVSGSGCSNCSAMSTTIGGDSYGANSYGGAISAAYMGAHSHSYGIGSLYCFSRAIIGNTQVRQLLITIKQAAIVDAMALSGEHSYMCLISTLLDRSDAIFQERLVNLTVPT
jgi:hypothetical protein